MADDDKLEPNDDPWAGLDAEGLPDLNDGFAFSFDDEPAQAAETAAEDIGQTFEAFAEPLAEEPLAEEPVAEEPVAEEPLFEPPSGDAEELIASDSLSLPEGLAELLSGPLAGDAGDAIAGSDERGESVAAADAAVGDWLGEPDGDPSALGIPALAAGDPASLDTPDQTAATLSVFTSDDDDDAFDSSGIDPSGESGAEQSTVQIGTGTSGIASPSSIGAFGSDAAPEEDGDPFAALDEEEKAEAEPWAALDDDQAEPAGTAETVGLAAAVATSPAPKKKTAPQPASRKKKPGMVGQLLGVIGGGLLSIPIVLGILWWGVGKDPLEVAPLVPDSLGFLLPAKLRAGGPLAPVARGAALPSLDDVLGAGSGSDSDDLVADDDLAMNDPEPEVDLAIPDPLEPSATDLVAADPLPASDEDEEDPLMALLNEESPAPVDPGVPEPEPLDTAGLEAAADRALAALAAVAAVEDLADPVGRKLLVDCYRSLAAYAQELALLERVATDTGRPLSELPASARAVPSTIAERREFFEPLARLTSDWLAFKRRPSDGVVAPATFLAARPVGPYWRTEVALGDKPLVVLSRSEPAAVAGETVIVTGLVIDGGVLWASEVQPANRADPFGP
jgi:hypothetical protein